MGGINAARENAMAMSKQASILEDRLNKTRQRYNEAVKGNTDLRASIDESRRQRLIFESIYVKLEQELQAKTAKMSRIIAESNEAFAERDRAQNEIEKLKKVVEKEQEEFDKEWKDLGKLIEDSAQLKGAMKSAQDQQNNETSEETKRKQEEEESLKKKVMRARWGVAQEKLHLQLTRERLEQYQLAFRKIQEETGETSIDKLVSNFIEGEKNIDWLMKCVSDINKDIEGLNGQIKEVALEIEKYKGQGESSDSQRKKILEQQEQA